MNKKSAQGLPDFLEEIGTGIIYIYISKEFQKIKEFQISLHAPTFLNIPSY